MSGVYCPVKFESEEAQFNKDKANGYTTRLVPPDGNCVGNLYKDCHNDPRDSPCKGCPAYTWFLEHRNAKPKEVRVA